MLGTVSAHAKNSTAAGDFQLSPEAGFYPCYTADARRVWRLHGELLLELHRSLRPRLRSIASLLGKYAHEDNVEIFFDLDGTLTDSGVGITRCLGSVLDLLIFLSTHDIARPLRVRRRKR